MIDLLHITSKLSGDLVALARRRIGILGIALVLAAGACSPIVEVHGFIPDDELVQQIKPGQHDRLYVEELLGSPSSIANFDGETWYYITRRTETLAFFEPEIKDQRVLAVVFDLATGTVSKVDSYGLDDGRLIELVERQTPTRGKQLGFFEQLFGNVGRFSGKPEQ